MKVTDFICWTQFGLDAFVAYDEENKLLKLTKDVSKAERRTRLQCMNNLRQEHRSSALYRALVKLLFKDKYKRYPHLVKVSIPLTNLEQAEQKHFRSH